MNKVNYKECILPMNTKLIALMLVVLCSACSSIGNSQKKFSHFHHAEQFNIASLGLYKVGIVALIDDTNSLTANERQQLTHEVFRTFGKEVEAENLVQTEELATHMGVENYQRLVQYAKAQDIQSLIQTYNQSDYPPSRYLLIMRLTDSRDLDKDNTLANDVFFNTNRCNTYGWALGLSMSIIDTVDATEVWGGHLNKDNKSQHCDDDNDFFDIDDDRSDKKNAESALAALALILVVSAIAEEMNQDDTVVVRRGLTPLFKDAVKDFAKELPNIYFR